MRNPIMRFFGFKQLPPELQKISAPFKDLALEMEEVVPDSAEKSAGMRKLVEAKDCFVRASLPPMPEDEW